MISLLTAASSASRPRLADVIEPPATTVALDVPAVAAFARGGAELWADGPRDDPEAFLRASSPPSARTSTLPPRSRPHLDRGARALVAERGPWEAEIPLAELASLGLPTLVVSGAHHAAFDAICDVLERVLSPSASSCRDSATTRSSTRRFNGALLAFVERSAGARDD